LVRDSITIVAQVNGKVRAKLEVPANITKEDAIELAKQHENVVKFLEGATVRKEIYVPGKLVNIVAN